MTLAPATVAAALQAAAARLEKAGIDEPYREAVFLLSHYLNCSPTLTYVRREEVLAPDIVSRFEQDLSRREKREPAALIRRQRAFFGREFLVTGDTLLPRPETELLVEAALRALPEEARALDIGTGTGCIAITVAAEKPSTRLVAIDLSDAALAVARVNAENHAVSDRIEFLSSDLYTALTPEKHGYFDTILANPPYIATSQLATLEPELGFEPRMALDGGDDGLIFIRTIVAGAPGFLKRGGRLFLEIGFDQGARVSRLMSEAGFTDVAVQQDYAGHDRILTGVNSGPI